MCLSETASWALGSALFGAGASAAAGVYSAQKQASATAKAAEQQEEIAKREAESSRQAARKADSQQADVSAILAQNATSGLGNGATMLSTAGDSGGTLGGGGKLGA